MHERRYAKIELKHRLCECDRLRRARETVHQVLILFGEREENPENVQARRPRYGLWKDGDGYPFAKDQLEDIVEMLDDVENDLLLFYESNRCFMGEKPRPKPLKPPVKMHPGARPEPRVARGPSGLSIIQQMFASNSPLRK